MPAESLTERSEEIRLEKRLVADRAAHPIVELVVSSFHTRDGTVRLVEPLSGVDAGNVAFRPGDEEHWEIEDGRLVFVTDIGWGETIETGYAIDVASPSDVGSDLATPRVELLGSDGSRVDAIGPEPAGRNAIGSGERAKDAAAEERQEDSGGATEEAERTASGSDGRDRHRGGTARGSETPDGVDRLYSAADADLADRFDRTHELAIEEDAIALTDDPPRGGDEPQEDQLAAGDSSDAGERGGADGSPGSDRSDGERE